MPARRRLDAELVRRGLSRSRESASQAIAQGRVLVGGSVATKPSTAVDAATSVHVTDVDGDDYASRGAHKLAGALDEWPDVRVSGARCLDAGASTGGFTDVLLRRGAAHVVAVDVGYGQLVWRLQSDERVSVLDRTNVRTLDADQIGGAVDLLVADLSFISLVTVLPALVGLCRPEAELLLMAKPQFEVGKGRVPQGGVVRDAALRAEAVLGVAEAAWALGLGTAGVVASPLPGPSGNVEFFLRLNRDAAAPSADDVAAAVAAGPA